LIELGKEGALTSSRPIFTTNTTIERLEQLLAQNPNGLLMMLDWLSGFFLQMELTGHNVDKSFYLSASDGHNSSYSDRITRRTVRLSNILMSVLGGMTPASLASFLLNPAIDASSADGMMQRFQLAIYPDKPSALVSIRDTDRYPDLETEKAALGVFRAFHTYRASTSLEVNQNGVPFVRFDKTAQEVFFVWHDDLQLRMNANSLHDAMRSHLAKFPRLMPALAFLFYAIKRLADEQPIVAIDEASARLAVRWCNFLESHARRIYAGLSSPEELTARLIASRLINGALNEKIEKNGGFFTPRDVYINDWQGLHESAPVMAGCEYLEELKWLSSTITGASTGRGRPPKKKFCLNPKIIKVFGKDFKEEKLKFVKVKKRPMKIVPKKTGKRHLKSEETFMKSCVFCGWTKPGVGQSQQHLTDITVVVTCDACFTSTPPETEIHELEKALVAKGFQSDPSKRVVLNVISRPQVEL